MNYIRASFKSLRQLRREAPTPEAARALLIALNDFWAIARMKGDLALEPHCDHPERSILLHYHRALRDLPWLSAPFIDFIRQSTLGLGEVKAAQRLLDGHLLVEQRHMDDTLSFAAMAANTAAAFGVIGTAGALAFAQVDWSHMAFGLIGSSGLLLLASRLWLARIRTIATERLGMLKALSVGCVAHLDGYAPMTTAEHARFSLPPRLRMTAKDLEEALDTEAFRHRHPDCEPTVEGAFGELFDDGDCDKEIAAYLNGKRPEDPDWLEKRLVPMLRKLPAELAPDQIAIAEAFAKLKALEDFELQRILREFNKDMLGIAFLGAPMPTVLRFFDNISKRAQKMLLDDMESFVRVPIDDIISAQGKVVAQVSEWMKTGQFRYDKEREEDLLEEWRRLTAGITAACQQPPDAEELSPRQKFEQSTTNQKY